MDARKPRNQLETSWNDQKRCSHCLVCQMIVHPLVIKHGDYHNIYVMFYHHKTFMYEQFLQISQPCRHAPCHRPPFPARWSRRSRLQNSAPPRDDIDGKTQQGRLERKGPGQTLQQWRWHCDIHHSWMVSTGKCHENGWLGGTSISGKRPNLCTNELKLGNRMNQSMVVQGCTHQYIAKMHRNAAHNVDRTEFDSPTGSTIRMLLPFACPFCSFLFVVSLRAHVCPFLCFFFPSLVVCIVSSTLPCRFWRCFPSSFEIPSCFSHSIFYVQLLSCISRITTASFSTSSPWVHFWSC